MPKFDIALAFTGCRVFVAWRCFIWGLPILLSGIWALFRFHFGTGIALTVFGGFAIWNGRWLLRQVKQDKDCED
jgi:hypothetical protein